MGTDDIAFYWTLPRFNKPGQLHGPIRWLEGRSGWLRPDYTSPGVKERIEAEVDFEFFINGDDKW